MECSSGRWGFSTAPGPGKIYMSLHFERSEIFLHSWSVSEHLKKVISRRKSGPISEHFENMGRSNNT